MQIITRMLLYDASYLVGLILMTVVIVLRAHVYGISKRRAAVYSLITFLFGFFGAWLIGKIYNLLAGLTGWYPGVKVDVIGAVIFTSPLVLAAVYTERAFRKFKNKSAVENGGDPVDLKNVNFRDTLDLMITGAFFMFASIKMGCMIRGCCWGVECGWGVESPYIHKTVFPIQIFESLSIFAVVIIVYFIKKTRFFRRGMGGPLSAFFYGVARFFWEFLRWYAPENRHFFLGLTLWQNLCVLIILVAALWTAILYKTQPSEPQPMSPGSEKLKEWLPSFTFRKPKKEIVHSKKGNAKKKRK